MLRYVHVWSFRCGKVAIMGGRMVVKLTTMMTFASNMTDLWLGCLNQMTIIYRFERIKAISKTPCPHVVVFYFYTKMSKVIPSVAGMSLPSNFYKSLLFLDSLERVHDQDGPQPTRRASRCRCCRRHRRLHTRFVEQCELWDFFCTYYGVITWELTTCLS